jgi:hypothetical protein
MWMLQKTKVGKQGFSDGGQKIGGWWWIVC